MSEGISNALQGFTAEEREIIIAMLSAYQFSGTESTYVAFVHELLAQVHGDVPDDRLRKIVKGMNAIKFQKKDFGPEEPGTNLNLNVVPTGDGWDRRSTRMENAPTSDGVGRYAQGAYEQGEDAEL